MRTAALIFAALVLSGCGGDKRSFASDGATVARICRDGDYIWHYTDGTYRTGWGYRVDDIDTVCQP